MWYLKRGVQHVTMRKRSLFHLCIVAGIFLLAAQLGLLAILLYGDHSSAPLSAVLDVQLFLNATASLHLPVILLDAVLLEKFTTTRQVLNDEDTGCIFCDISNPIAFGALYKHVSDQREVLQSQLESVGFSSVVLLNTLPPEPAAPKSVRDAPIAVVLRKQDPPVGATIQLVLLHERDADFWWHGAAVSDFGVNNKLLSVGVKSLGELSIMQSEGAFDKFEGSPVQMDGLRVVVPSNIPGFLDQKSQSRYVECSHSRAAAFHEQHGVDEGRDAIRFRHRAWKLLARAKKLLDEMGIPFWLSSGTCLGYFRQCDIISYSKDVDLGILASDYQDQLVPRFTKHGLRLKHWFGQLNDSLELSFVSGDLKLDLFFFYEEGNVLWNGGTQAKSGLKFKYNFPHFSLCWTEFLELKVRVPCETLSYIQANYGASWDIPQQQWDWKSSPPNVKPNGAWPRSIWPQVIRVY
ncbi:hypothetical protein B566_EDAN000773 [Ephemera danica]|nr:hypothetical protein B566_EDAN000773 [Ephemera danica]